MIETAKGTGGDRSHRVWELVEMDVKGAVTGEDGMGLKPASVQTFGLSLECLVPICRRAEKPSGLARRTVSRQ